MTTYNTYQEAKLAMTLACIIEDTDSGLFFGMPSREGTTLAGGSRFAEPQYYCMTVEKFLADGHKFVEGDLILDEGVTWTVSDKVNSGTYIYTVKSSNKPDIDDNERYILRAAALESQMNIDNLATQTPEEKEALDSMDWSRTHELAKSREREYFDLIDTTSHTNVKYKKWNFECAWHAIKAFEDGEKLYTKRSHKDYILIDSAPDVLRFLYDLHERIECDESPQQREEREREELADTACESLFGESIQNCRPDVAATVRCMIDAGYRKEQSK